MTNETQTQVICPYCGHAQAESPRCESCRGLFEPLSRQATQNAMGPWFIRDEAQPFRPGCSYDTLLRLIERGRVTAETILRGPTTHQFWMRADHVPGLAHLMDRCHACGERVGRGDVCCEFCGVMFGIEAQRDSLGLLPVRDLEAMAGALRTPPAAERDRRLESVGYDRLRAAVQAAGPAMPPHEAPGGAPVAAPIPDSLAAAVEQSGDLVAPRQVRRRRIRREELTTDQLAAEQRRRERRMLIVKGSIAAATILLTALVLLWVLIKAGALALPFHVPGTGPREGAADSTSNLAPGAAAGDESPDASTTPPSESAGEGAEPPAPSDQPPPVAAAEPQLDPLHAELLELYREAVRLVDGTTLAELERAEAIFNRVERELPPEAHPEDLAAQQRKVARRLGLLRDDPGGG